MRELPKHAEALIWVNELVMDLKLMLDGRQMIQGITPARLAEWEALREDVRKCRETVRVWHQK
jgi:hypothetical protein